MPSRSRDAKPVHVSRLLIGSWLALVCVAVAPPGRAECGACHAPIEPIASGKMLERILRVGRRYGDAEGCVVCHGGRPDATEAESAHSGSPKGLAASGGPESFYPNPGATTIAHRTCGRCHEGYAERWQKSIMSTEAGVIARNLCEPARHRLGARGDTSPAFGRYAVRDRDGSEPSVGSPTYKALMSSLVASFTQGWKMELRVPPPLASVSSTNRDRRSCNDCHASHAAETHGTGCSACHIPYRRSGSYLGQDPTIDKAKPGELLLHRLQGTGAMRVTLPGRSAESWSGIPLENCFLCHFDVRRVEVSPLGPIHTHYAGRYEAKGGTLLCQDCHTTIEMHGDGNIPSTDADQREVRCEDCHGTTQSYPWELPLQGFDDGDGIFRRDKPRGLAKGPPKVSGKKPPASDGYLLTSRGNPFGNVIKRDEHVWLYSASGTTHEVTLLKYAKQHDAWRSNLARQTKADTDGHDRMPCTDCHTDWAPPCYGCHAQALPKK